MALLTYSSPPPSLSPIHAIMGKNGSGKSTFSKVLVDHPDYEVIEGSVLFKGQNLLDMEPEERSHVGLQTYQYLFWVLSLQFYSLVTPKVAILNMNLKFLDRNVNEGFSGGEKKRNEILQLCILTTLMCGVLKADLAILDEIDGGLDVDALQDMAKAEDGKIVKTGDVSLAKQLEREGYRGISVS
ncbi:ABC transporter I family member 6, chloroplastic [Canna indica]|uniref:ABC transporter I family member 6, chloroplastic n=1 Tax=Canna indica TaxID=4628 RepID=A0AAQ3JQV3_9LILI|nr:ABC transporter I family member 6, chloroplastic [Canna indica]